MNYVIRDGRRIAVVTKDFGKPRKKKRDFVITTRAQFERLCTARRAATFKVFYQLQFLIFRSHIKSVRLANVTLAKCNVSRKQKRAALIELETKGLIRDTRYRHRSPEVVILDLS
jgi:hypothetical protein